MSLEQVVNAAYGPYSMRISPEKVAEYVAVTGDSPERWNDCAPPSFAGALLFVVAPHFLADDRVRPFTGVLVHVDQTFIWHGPLTIGDAINVTGRVDKVRERGGRFFVTFSADVATANGQPVLEAVATFLMGEGSPSEGSPSGDTADPGEPEVLQRGSNELAGVGSLRTGEPTPKSASRLDLVKYAAASGDYNPIHFDHDAARNAGLEGIVVHGLLMAAWAMQSAATTSDRPDPLASIKLRFRNALRPGVQAAVTGAVKDSGSDGADAQLALAVTSDGTQLVTAVCAVRMDP